MSITLITGTPGAGKTLYCVDQILKPESVTGRRIYTDGIPELLIPHEPALDPLTWPDWAEDGSHLFFDECQRFWRPESAQKAPHPSIAALETHRHRGLDFTIITQHPNLIHANVRRLVGRHIHVRQTWAGVYVHEWPECKTNPDAARKSSASIKWPRPKSSFGLYKSATMHIKPKYRIPRQLWFVLAGLCLIPVLIYACIKMLSNPLATIDMPGQSSAAGMSAAVSSGSPAMPTGSASKPVTDTDLREQFIPRVYGQPETAPAYDTLRVVKQMPQSVACIATDTRCACYTQQATQIEMTQEQCRAQINSRRFDPYSDADRRADRVEASVVSSPKQNEA